MAIQCRNVCCQSLQIRHLQDTTLQLAQLDLVTNVCHIGKMLFLQNDAYVLSWVQLQVCITDALAMALDDANLA